MLRILRAFALGWALCLAARSPSRAAAQASRDPQAEAAVHFDVGVQAYKQADYPRAAEAFLAADAALGSVAALSNALSAARRADLPLLVARAAERIASRLDMPAAEREAAAEALREVAPRLAQVQIDCPSAAECAPQIDGVPLAQSGSYVLPGTHRVDAAGYRAETLRCVAAQPCRVQLSPQPQVPPSAARAAAEVSGPRSAPRADVSADLPLRDEGVPRWKRRLPLGVFIGSGAGALALAALATWSGVEALQAKRDYDSVADDWDDVRKLARRSDLFLAGSLVLAGTAVATAIWWVEWDALGRSQLTLLPEGGATLIALRRF